MKGNMLHDPCEEKWGCLSRQSTTNRPSTRCQTYYPDLPPCFGDRSTSVHIPIAQDGEDQRDEDGKQQRQHGDAEPDVAPAVVSWEVEFRDVLGFGLVGVPWLPVFLPLGVG